jgi:hypothetical protein
MITIASMDTIGIGLNDGAWKSLSRDAAESLLRVCTLPRADERTYTNVNILPTPSGRDLYVRTSLSM